MKTRIIAFALLTSVVAAGCFAPATQEDIDALEAEESGQIGVAEEELMNTGNLSFVCNGTACYCEPGADSSDAVTCEGFQQTCGALNRKITCCGWKQDRRAGLIFACADGFTELGVMCTC